jgi:RNA polymerase sigma-70 factor (ECF subfamily)
MSTVARMMVSAIAAPESAVPESSVYQPHVDTQGSSEAGLPEGVHEAESRSFDALYEAHFEFVWRTLRRFGVPASVAEDAAQDAFVVLHRKLPELRPEASAKGFLFSIARRVASDYRRASRRPQASLDAERTESTDRGPFDRAADREAGEALEAFLESLDEDKRAVFVLVELEGLTMPEVSQLLATNINTLYSRVRSARAQLLELFASQGERHE